MSCQSSRTWLVSSVAILAATVWLPLVVGAQAHDHQMPPGKSNDDHMVGMADHAMSSMAMDSIMSRHMELTPARLASHDDSSRALTVVGDLRRAIAKYKDVSAAERDGFRMFAPDVKNQRVYHFTNYRNAFGEAFRFDPEKPTSLLYKRAPDGQLILIGAMYTMSKRADIEKLNERVPLGIARWHKHVNWCVPKRGEASRWTERQNGLPVFGPESPIATKEACDAVGGNFFPSPLGWMVHANVFAGDDLGSIFADDHGSQAEHAGHQM